MKKRQKSWQITLLLILVYTVLFTIDSSQIRAEEREELFYKHVLPGEIISAGTNVNNTLLVMLSVSRQTAIISYNNNKYVVDIKDCIVKDNIEACYMGIRSGLSAKLGEYYEAEIRITKITKTARLETTSSITRTNMLIEDVATIKTEIKNIGEKNAEDAEYMTEFPKQVQITKTQGCAIEDNTAAWRGRIEPGAKTTCEVDIMAKHPAEFITNSNLSYNNSIRMISEPGKDNFNITIAQRPINLSIEGPNTSIKVGESAIIKVKVRTTTSADVERTEAALKLSETILIKKTDFPGGKELLWKGNLQAIKSETFTTEIVPTKTGMQTAQATASYSEGGKIKQAIDELQLEVIPPDMGFVFYTANEENKTIMRLLLKNWDQNEIKEIIITINLDGNTTTEKISAFKAGEVREMLSSRMEEKHDLMATAEFYTAYGEKIIQKYEKKIEPGKISGGGIDDATSNAAKLTFEEEKQMYTQKYEDVIKEYEKKEAEIAGQDPDTIKKFAMEPTVVKKTDNLTTLLIVLIVMLFLMNFLLFTSITKRAGILYVISEKLRRKPKIQVKTAYQTQAQNAGTQKLQIQDASKIENNNNQNNNTQTKKNKTKKVKK